MGRRAFNIPSLAALAGLASLPLLGAAAGGWFDERLHQGFSAWRSACRAAGYSYSSILVFTFELLPTAIIGALLGGLAVQGFALLADRPRDRAACLAAHAGCVVAMPAGLALCALALPLPATLLAETALAISAAYAIRTSAYSRHPRCVKARIPARRTAIENSPVIHLHERTHT